MYVCVYIRSSQVHFLDNNVAVTKLNISVPDILECTDFHRLDFLGKWNIISGFPLCKKWLENTALIQSVQTVSEDRPASCPMAMLLFHGIRVAGARSSWTHLHLTLSLKMSVAVYPLHICLPACTEKTSLFWRVIFLFNCTKNISYP